MGIHEIDSIEEFIAHHIQDLEPQDAVNTFAEIESFCESSRQALEEEYGVEAE